MSEKTLISFQTSCTTFHEEVPEEDDSTTVQPLFESWYDLMDSYLRGYEYWAGESSEERRAIYEELKTRDDNPYQIDVKLELIKTW